MKHFIHSILLTSFFSLYAASIAAQDTSAISSLSDLLHLAGQRSLAVKVLQLGVDVAQKDIAVAKNAFLPDASFSASAGYNSNAWVCDRDFTNGQSFSSPHFANSFGLEASILVFAGGATINSIKAKEIKASIAKWNLEECRQQVYFLLVSYYLDYCKSLNMLEVFDKNIAQTRMMISEMSAKAAVGLALENDITRYEVQLQNLLYSHKELESTALIFHNRMTTTLDLSPNISIVQDSALLSLTIPALTIEGAQALADTNSPMLNRSALEIKLIDRNMDIAKSGYYPNVRLYAGDNLKGPIIYEIPTLNNNINVWYFGVGLSYNLGNLYKAPKEISKLSASRLQANMQLEARREEVSLNVHDSYIRYLDAFELLKTQETTLRLAEENYVMMENRYKNGLVLATDLVDADNLRLSAEIQLVNARINIVYNYYKLLYAAGSINPDNNLRQ